jgi:radical SAM protein with 4Fe4S-binding SPASM domain
MAENRTYFCNEPWIGIFSVEVNQDVTFCPCFLKLKIGNLNENALPEIWNSESMVKLRESFSKGELPKVCEGQLCPVAQGVEKHVVVTRPGGASTVES